MNGGGKPELRVSATGASAFEGTAGHQVNLAIVAAEPKSGIVRVVAAVYNGQSIPVNESSSP